MPIEIRYQGEGKARHIDEIIAKGGSVHVEQLDNALWYFGIEDADGTNHQFWLGLKSGRGEVVFRHQETTPAALKEAGE